jgi:hypothetical protein
MFWVDLGVVAQDDVLLEGLEDQISQVNIFRFNPIKGYHEDIVQIYLVQ